MPEGVWLTRHLWRCNHIDGTVCKVQSEIGDYLAEICLLCFKNNLVPYGKVEKLREKCIVGAVEDF